jgi:hypothetical protein
VDVVHVASTPPPPPVSLHDRNGYLLSLCLPYSLSPLNVIEDTGLLVLAWRGIGAWISLQGDRRLNQIQMITKNGCILYLFFFRGTVDRLCLGGGRPAVWLTPYKLHRQAPTKQKRSSAGASCLVYIILGAWICTRQRHVQYNWATLEGGVATESAKIKMDCMRQSNRFLQISKGLLIIP